MADPVTIADWREVHPYVRKRTAKNPKRDFAKAREVVFFITKHLRMPDGEPIKLFFWQRRLMLELFEEDFKGNRIKTRAILSMSRKNGKSLVIAMIVCAFLAGRSIPESGWRRSGRPTAATRPRSCSTWSAI